MSKDWRNWRDVMANPASNYLKLTVDNTCNCDVNDVTLNLCYLA